MRLKSALASMAVAAIIASPILAAHLVWRLTPIRHLRLTVVDYSVPNETYWNHKGLFWLLNHLRIREPSTGGDWRAADHYIGFDPRGPGKGTRVSEAALDAVDWIYLADTYGVHLSDRAPVEGDAPVNGFIFGGLSGADAAALKRFADKGGSIISEFNSLSDPTPKAAREIVAELMGITWLGWAGRFVPSFAEVPDSYPWFDALYRKSYGSRPRPEGHGMMLIHEDGRLVVLSGAPFEQSMPTLALSTAGREWMEAPVGAPPYYGWFGVVSEEGDADTLADIVMPTPEGWEEAFRAQGIPKAFPLITRRTTTTGTYIYIAANISIVDELPTYHQLAFLPGLLAMVHRRRDSLHHGPAFWQIFAPVVGRILADAANATARPEEAR